MRIVQMIVEVGLCLLAQTLTQGCIFHHTGDGLSKGLSVARRHQQTVLFLYDILPLTTVISNNHRMTLRHIFLWRERTALLNR